MYWILQHVLKSLRRWQVVAETANWVWSCWSTATNILFHTHPFVSIVTPYSLTPKYKVCECHFPWNWRLEMVLVELDSCKVCSCASAINLVSIMLGKSQQNDKVENTAKFGILCSSRVTINWSRWNMAHERRPWVYSSMPNLAHIGQGGGYKSPSIFEK